MVWKSIPSIMILPSNILYQKKYQKKLTCFTSTSAKKHEGMAQNLLGPPKEAPKFHKSSWGKIHQHWHCEPQPRMVGVSWEVTGGCWIQNYLNSHLAIWNPSFLFMVDQTKHRQKAERQDDFKIVQSCGCMGFCQSGFSPLLDHLDLVHHMFGDIILKY